MKINKPYVNAATRSLLLTTDEGDKIGMQSRQELQLKVIHNFLEMSYAMALNPLPALRKSLGEFQWSFIRYDRYDLSDEVIVKIKESSFVFALDTIDIVDVVGSEFRELGSPVDLRVETEVALTVRPLQGYTGERFFVCSCQYASIELEDDDTDRQDIELFKKMNFKVLQA